MTTKENLIDSIRHHNRSASDEFLIGFDELALQQYLTHLQTLSRPRGRDTMWIRTAETPAVVARLRAAPA